jgi:hypothetical protein
MRAPALQWERLRMAQKGGRRWAAEQILLEYLADIKDYARAKEELRHLGYTEEQALRMLVRVALRWHPQMTEPGNDEEDRRGNRLAIAAWYTIVIGLSVYGAYGLMA